MTCYDSQRIWQRRSFQKVDAILAVAIDKLEEG
jgi:hypothetical protein